MVDKSPVLSRTPLPSVLDKAEVEAVAQYVTHGVRSPGPPPRRGMALNIQGARRLSEAVAAGRVHLKGPPNGRCPFCIDCRWSPGAPGLVPEWQSVIPEATFGPVALARADFLFEVSAVPLGYGFQHGLRNDASWRIVG